MKVKIKAILLTFFIIAVCACSLGMLNIYTTARAAEIEPYVTVESDFIVGSAPNTSRIEGLNADALKKDSIHLKIPATINGVQIKKINGSAFKDKAQITALDFSMAVNLTEIGSSAFVGTSISGELVLPNGVTSIGGLAFSSTKISGALVIPNSVIDIQQNAFSSCTGLISVTLGNSLKTVGNSVFSGCNGLAGNLVFPETLETIGNSAFLNCVGLSGDLRLPDSVKSIGSSAFSGCSGFVGGLKLPTNSLYSIISSFAFANMTGLTGNLVIPSSVTQIANDAFINCKLFSGGLTLPNSVKLIGNSAFKGCDGLNRELILQENLETIGNSAFASCGFIGGLTFPSTLTSIGNFAFSGCKGFNGKLTLPTNPAYTTLSEKLFDGGVGFIGDLVIPDNITSINANAFTSSKFTGELKLSKKLRMIGAFAFSGCSFTGNLTIPNTVTSIGVSAFSNNRGFTGSLILPSSLLVISSRSFENCSGFTGDLDIPASVVTIGEKAFNSSFGLESLSFEEGSSLTTIEIEAFVLCYSLSGAIKIPESVTAIKSAAFAGCEKVNAFWLKSNTIYGEKIFSDHSGRKVTAYFITDGDFDYGKLLKTLPDYANKITYEIRVDFDGIGTNELKLYNQPMSLLYSEAGLWSNNASYALPEASMQNKNHLGWSFSENGETISKTDIVTSSKLYPLFESLQMLASYTPGKGYTMNGFSEEYLAGLKNPNDVKLEIPTIWNDGVNGDAAVVGINDNAFQGQTRIRGVVVISEGIISIGDYTFKGCTGITDLYLPQSIVSIGKGAFVETSTYIFASSKAAYDKLFRNLNIGTNSKLTYEMIVKFHQGDEVISTQTKAFNQDIRLVKDMITMHWSLNAEYVLPTIDIPSGYKLAGWIATKVASDGNYLVTDGASNSSFVTSDKYYIKLFSDPIDLSWLLILIVGLNILLAILLALIFIMIYIKGVKYNEKKNKRLMSVVPFIGAVIVPPTIIGSQMAIIGSLGGLLLLEIGALVFLILKMRSDRRKRLARDLSEKDIDTSAVMIDKI